MTQTERIGEYRGADEAGAPMQRGQRPDPDADVRGDKQRKNADDLAAQCLRAIIEKTGKVQLWPWRSPHHIPY